MTLRLKLVLAALLAALVAPFAIASTINAHTGKQSYVYLEIFDTAIAGRVEYPIASNQWAVTASKLIDSSKMLMLSVRYDSEDHEFLYWETAFEFKTKHSIVYRIFLSERFGTAKEDEFAVNFGVRLLSF